ncbi:hypothetical protein XbrCFBP1976_19390 [Xanthomonas bromi]|uniref:Uncharacterized protein n=1 Tax=Xanthomonas bromi TaxID=56449 RepID=A0ABX5BL01_9XANT|nr:hypothetical protein XbrCFBP1976_19390 [Xanthomonas bromi]
MGSSPTFGTKLLQSQQKPFWRNSVGLFAVYRFGKMQVSAASVIPDAGDCDPLARVRAEQSVRMSGPLLSGVERFANLCRMMRMLWS